MIAYKLRNAVLALGGLAALGIYILACTSFSPDDTKVVYPAFDTSGSVGMAVYDRTTKKSEMLFLPPAPQSTASNSVNEPVLMRPAWLDDGRNILVVYPTGGGNDKALDLAMVPWGAGSPIRFFQVTNLDVGVLKGPLCVVGERVFLAAGNAVVRLDLKTGSLSRHQFPDDILIFPESNGREIVCLNQQKEGLVCGRLNLEDFSITPWMTITNELHLGLSDGLFAMDSRARKLVVAPDAETNSQIIVFEPGKRPFTRTVGKVGEKWTFGSLGFSASGDAVWATFQKQGAGAATNTASYGLVELPLSQAPIRETVLIPSAPAGDSGVLYFQAAVSHDGQTAALASTYLACAVKEFNPADCALFLVDLGRPERTVTRIPIPVPPQHAQAR